MQKYSEFWLAWFLGACLHFCGLGSKRHRQSLQMHRSNSSHTQALRFKQQLLPTVPKWVFQWQQIWKMWQTRMIMSLFFRSFIFYLFRRLWGMPAVVKPFTGLDFSKHRQLKVNIFGSHGQFAVSLIVPRKGECLVESHMRGCQSWPAKNRTKYGRT